MPRKFMNNHQMMLYYSRRGEYSPKSKIKVELTEEEEERLCMLPYEE